ncbi:MAG: peptidylprolyl isomerase [Cyanobacteria bacterium SBLK]|nr:peptidylprolyl isomerase [Cyanobacteria bacterium SBLK]
MQNTSFLKIDDRSISLQQALRYLKSSGGYQRTLLDIVRQYLLEEELHNREDIQVSNIQIDQALMDFRVHNNLQTPEQFQDWLNKNGIPYEEFRTNIVFGFKIEKLKTEISESKLESYFQEQKPLLDRAILSRIILDNQELAEQIKQKILGDRSQFESLAREHSLTDDRVANGMMGTIPKGQMPDLLRTAIDLATPGEIVGPLEIDGRYCLFRLEQVLPVSLEEVSGELKNQLFEKWLEENLEKLTIKLEIE